MIIKCKLCEEEQEIRYREVTKNKKLKQADWYCEKEYRHTKDFLIKLGLYRDG